MPGDSGQEKKLVSLENIEKIIEPSKSRKTIFVLIYIAVTAMQIYLDYFLRTRISEPNVGVGMESHSITRCLTVSIFLHIAVLALSIGGITHNHLTPWTFGTTFSFIATLLTIYSHFYSYFHPPSDNYSISLNEFVNLLAKFFFISYLFSYYICFVFSIFTAAILCYQVLTLRSQSKFNLNIEDPQEQFVNRFLNSLMYILPGLGIAKTIFKTEKKD